MEKFRTEQGKKVSQTYCLPKLSFAFIGFCLRESDKMQQQSKVIITMSRATVLCCQLPPLRAEGSKKSSYFKFTKT